MYSKDPDDPDDDKMIIDLFIEGAEQYDKLRDLGIEDPFLKTDGDPWTLVFDPGQSPIEVVKVAGADAYPVLKTAFDKANTGITKDDNFKNAQVAIHILGVTFSNLYPVLTPPTFYVHRVIFG